MEQMSLKDFRNLLASLESEKKLIYIASCKAVYQGQPTDEYYNSVGEWEKNPPDGLYRVKFRDGEKNRMRFFIKEGEVITEIKWIDYERKSKNLPKLEILEKNGTKIDLRTISELLSLHNEVEVVDAIYIDEMWFIVVKVSIWKFLIPAIVRDGVLHRNDRLDVFGNINKEEKEKLLKIINEINTQNFLAAIEAAKNLGNFDKYKFKNLYVIEYRKVIQFVKEYIERTERDPFTKIEEMQRKTKWELKQ